MGEDSPHLDLMNMIEIDDQTMADITEFDRITAQMTEGEKAQLEKVMSVYDPTKSDAENAAAMQAVPETQSLHERYSSIFGTWSDEDNLHPDKSLIDREIVEYHQKIKELEALPVTDSRRDALGFYEEALHNKYETKYSVLYGKGMLKCATFFAEGYLGGVIFRVLKLGYLAARGHQVLKAGETLPYVFRGGVAGQIALSSKDTWRIPGEVTQLARQLMQATKAYGGKLFYNKLTKDQLGYVIHLQKGRKSLQIRIMDKGGQQLQPYWRVTIDGKGAFTSSGQLTSDKAISHIPINSQSYKNILEIIKQQMGIK